MKHVSGYHRLMIRFSQGMRLTAIRLLLMSFGAVLFSGGVSNAVAQDSAGEAKAWYDYYLHRASTDYLLTGKSEKRELSLVPTPILNWTNPLEAGQINGSSFVWELKGRPMVIGQFFSYLIGNDRRNYCHVFTTLSDDPVEAKYKDRLFWRPAKSDKTGWITSQSSSPVGENPLIRLRQMRNIARQFSTYTEESSRGRRNLRLLPQPLFRYRQENKDLDGGLFAYVVGNDPELMLLVECDLTSETPSWRYRFVQSTRSTTVAVRKGEEVYRFDKPDGDPADPESQYLSRHGVQTIRNDPKLLESSGDE